MTLIDTASASADVARMLGRHYIPEGRPPAGMLALEIGSPCGKRRADAIWVPMTSAAGGLVGHEVKVSRGDLMTELADPAKPDPWLRYCERWWLTVSDPAMIEGLGNQIPEAWGILAPPSGRRTRSMTVLRPAPKLKPAHTAPAYARLLTWHFSRADLKIRESEYRASAALADLARAQEALRNKQATGLHPTDPFAVRVTAILAAVQDRQRAEWSYAKVSDGAVVEAILDEVRTRELAEEVRRDVEALTHDVRRSVEPLSEVADALERLRAGKPRRDR